MKAFQCNSQSERMQGRWDPQYHAAAKEHSSNIARLEKEMDKGQAAVLALDILAGFDTQAWSEMRIMAHGSAHAQQTNKPGIELGVKLDPFLGLSLAQCAGSRMVERMERDAQCRQGDLQSLLDKLSRISQRELPLVAAPSRSLPRP